VNTSLACRNCPAGGPISDASRDTSSLDVSRVGTLPLISGLRPPRGSCRTRDLLVNGDCRVVIYKPCARFRRKACHPDLPPTSPLNFNPVQRCIYLRPGWIFKHCARPVFAKNSVKRPRIDKTGFWKWEKGGGEKRQSQTKVILHSPSSFLRKFSDGSKLHLIPR